ncbi:MAG: tetratricopeptide repeat protein [Planctomycetota bacterium]|nr:tetratricopeptide repeat protein [Planctomycetota bacterium]
MTSASETAPEPGTRRPSTRVFGLLLVLAGAAAYWTAIPAAFVFDDRYFIVEDDTLERLWPPGGRHAQRPVLIATLAANRILGGLDPRWFHATNVAIHLCAALLLFGLLRRTLSGPRLGGRLGTDAAPIAFAVALLWLLHPLATMAVTYVWQRGESLMGLFFLAVLYSIVRAAQGGRRRAWSAAALAAFFAGLGTKETMVTVLPVAVLFDGTLIAPSVRAALARRRWLYGAMAAALVAGAAVVVPGMDTSYDAIGPLRYAASQPGVVLEYLRLACWPDPLCFDYQRPAAYGPWEVALPTIAVALLVLACVRGLARGSWIGLCGVTVVLILAPTSSFVPINDLMVEYRMYLPLAALAALAVGAGRAFCRWAFLPPPVLLGAVALASGWGTARRNLDYASEGRLWRTVVEVAPQNHRAHYMLGVIALREGDRAGASEALETALRLGNSHRAEVEAGSPGRGVNCAALPPRTLGEAFFRLGRLAPDPAAGLHAFEHAVELDPDSAAAWMHLGVSLRAHGEVARSLACLDRSIELGGGDSRSRSNRGLALLELGRAGEARAAFDRALALEPGFDVALYGRGRAHLAMDLEEEARQDLEALLRTTHNESLRAQARRLLGR